MHPGCPAPPPPFILSYLHINDASAFTDVAAHVLSRCTSLRHLCLNHASALTSAGFAALGRLTRLTALELPGKSLYGDAPWPGLSAALRCLTRLCHLDLSCSAHMSHALCGGEAFADALSGLVRLRSLLMCRRLLSADDAPLVAAALARLPCLRHVELEADAFGTVFSPLVCALAQGPGAHGLRVLRLVHDRQRGWDDWDQDPQEDSTFGDAADALSHLTALVSLTLERHELPLEDTGQVLAAVQNLTNLQVRAGL